MEATLVSCRMMEVLEGVLDWIGAGGAEGDAAQAFDSHGRGAVAAVETDEVSLEDPPLSFPLGADVAFAGTFIVGLRGGSGGGGHSPLKSQHCVE